MYYHLFPLTEVILDLLSPPSGYFVETFSSLCVEDLNQEGCGLIMNCNASDSKGPEGQPEDPPALW